MNRSRRNGPSGDILPELRGGAACGPTVLSPAPKACPRPLLITGRTGALGRAFGRLCELRGIHHLILSRQELDIASPSAVSRAFRTHRPWGVINAAGYVRVDEAEEDRDACFRANTFGPMVLAAACAEHNVGLLTFSSGLVFDGDKASPYLESDRVAPLSIYGKSKADAERHVPELLPQALVVRTGACFGPWDRYNFVTSAISQLQKGVPVLAAADLVVSPTYIPDLVHTCLDLFMDGEQGIRHVSNRGAVSWAELAEMCARLAGIDTAMVIGCSAGELGMSARRPSHSVLGSERGVTLPPLDDALERYLSESSR